jgi:hypothetical protein
MNKDSFKISRWLDKKALTPLRSGGLGPQIPPVVRYQGILLALVTFAFVAPRLYTVGTNIVTETYRLGALRLLTNDCPYRLPLGGGDRFEYSPFFALIYLPLSMLPAKAQALTWALVNCLIFWWGVCSWFRIERQTSRWLILAFLACSVEANISLLYQQINAAIIGLMLISFARFRDGHTFLAGILLTLATNIKPLPALTAFALLFTFNRNFFLGCFFGSLLCLFAPVLWIGWGTNWTYHVAWYGTLKETMILFRLEQVDIATLLGRVGWGGVGTVLQYTILGLTALTLIWAALQKNIPWAAWIATATSGLLISSPRSESPTFVLIAPAYLFLTSLIEDETRSRPWRSVLFGVLYFSAFLTTFCFTDLWPKRIWNPLALHYATKTIGTTLMWCLSISLLVRSLVGERAHRPLLINHPLPV